MFKFFKNVAFYLLIVVAAIWVMDHYSAGSTNKTDISYTAFMKHVQQDEVRSVTITENSITGLLKDGKTFTTVAPNDSTLIATLRSRDVEIKAELPPQTPWWATLLSTLLPMILIVGLWFMLMNQSSGGSRMMNFGKSNARRYDESKNKITFKDVAGADEAKQELQEVVEFLKHPQRYNALGAKIPKGVLLYGPPGTGKTLLARAVAGEAGVPFFTISGSDFVEMFVGVGASRVRDLFDQAKRNAPSIVFIDEIDAVGRHRGAGLGGGHDEREQTLNQLLVEMDGFSTNEGVIVMAATNRRDILDPALLRPGRFDRQVTVNYPDINGRVAILKVHSKGKPLADDVDLENIAKRTPYATGADLENIMNEGAIQAAREKQTVITQAHLIEAVERIQMGPEKKSHKVLEEDRKLVAYHEAGHAIVGHYLPLCDDVHTITVVPRGGAGGFTLSLPSKELDNISRSQLLQRTAMSLGGHAAEKLIFHDIYTGAQSDLQHATSICRAMVTRYGMSEKIGTIFLDSEQEVFLGNSFAQNRDFSEETAAAVDHEVGDLLRSCYELAMNTLKEHQDKLEGLAQLLIEKETLSREDFMAFIDGVPADAQPEETGKAEEPETSPEETQA